MRLLIITLILALSAPVFSQQSAKEQAVDDFRIYFSKNAYRGHQLAKPKVEQFTSQQCIDLLGDDGRFTDLVAEQEKVEQEKMNLINSTPPQRFVGDLGEKAFNRMWRIAQTYRGQAYDTYKNDATFVKLCKAINNYSRIEADRGKIPAGRFHQSCFAIPTAAVNTYFCLFYAMEDIENGQENRKEIKEANKNLIAMSYQSWTHPWRMDKTDDNVVSIQRFQKHVWWVGGNGLGFRSLLPTAAAMRSVEMMDVLSEVAKGGLSSVSQNTWDKAFWTEGFTADGAGWGHGMQCLIWGYPISGTSAALSLIEYFKGTPWAKQLEEENAQALLNYFRGSSWYYYKGYVPRCLGRGSMKYSEFKEQAIGTDQMINTTIESWLSSYSKGEQQELLDFQEDIKDHHISMAGYKGGYYNGTRWFFNNDNLIKKNPNYYQFVSMASVRCDGIEMAKEMADKFNFHTCDGMTFFMRDGTEYHNAIGAWNLTALPGVTSRQVPFEKLVPMRNWRGYCSKHNFAAAATSGTKNAAAGFIFEKMNASNKKNVNDTTGRIDPNDLIYGVKAHKAYFMVDDYMVALGAGIRNLHPDMEGDIWTSIEQTTSIKNIKYYSSNKTQSLKEHASLQLKGEKLVWAQQKGGFAYAVLPKYTTGEVFFSAETRKTRWDDINESNKRYDNEPKEADVFEMHINHGRQVTDGTYAYVVYAGAEDGKTAFKNMPVKILQNTEDIQAVSWGQEYIGVSFYNPGTTLETDLGKFKVSAPCALLLEQQNSKWILTVTDAMMNAELKSIEVTTTMCENGAVWKDNAEWKVISVPMPQGKYCGQPSTVEL